MGSIIRNVGSTCVGGLVFQKAGPTGVCAHDRFKYASGTQALMLPNRQS